MTDFSGSAAWTYDNRGRTTREVKVISGSGTYTTSWSYNGLNQVTSMTYPDGEVLATTYNLMNLPSTLKGTLSGYSTNNEYVTSSSYNAFGQPKRFDLNNFNPTFNDVLVQHFGYAYYSIGSDLDAHDLWGPSRFGRLMEMCVGPSTDACNLGSDAGISEVAHLDYWYDDIGNVTSIRENKNSSQLQNFTYDELDRMTKASTSGGGTGTYNYSYGYNTIGNMITKTEASSVNYTYPASGAGSVRPHAVTSVGSSSYGYDSNGNMTSRTVSGVASTFTYEAENRLTGVTGGATATFVYDGDGKRVKATFGTNTTIYIGNYYEISGTTPIKYYYFGSQRIAMPVVLG